MAICVEEDIFGFEISVDNVEGVQMVQSQGDLGSVELGHWLWEPLNSQICQ